MRRSVDHGHGHGLAKQVRPSAQDLPHHSTAAHRPPLEMVAVIRHCSLHLPAASIATVASAEVAWLGLAGAFSAMPGACPVFDLGSAKVRFRSAERS